jgi:hypothetical protein
MKKHKITPEVYKELITQAKALPKFQRTDNKNQLMFRYETKRKKGSELTEQERTLFPDENIRANVRYPILYKWPVMVNHEENIINIYKKEGRPGVNAYVEFFQAEYEKAQKLAAGMAEKQPEVAPEP